MSKLVEKLRQISEGASQPLGFRTGGTSPGQSMLLIAALPQTEDQFNIQKFGEVYRQYTQKVPGWNVLKDLSRLHKR